MTERPGKQFGPEPHQFDPYHDMSDEEFEREVVAPLRRQSATISLRMPMGLLMRTKDVAAAHDVPYQALIKALLEKGLERMESVERVVAAAREKV